MQRYNFFYTYTTIKIIKTYNIFTQKTTFFYTIEVIKSIYFIIFAQKNIKHQNL